MKDHASAAKYKRNYQNQLLDHESTEDASLLPSVFQSMQPTPLVLSSLNEDGGV